AERGRRAAPPHGLADFRTAGGASEMAPSLGQLALHGATAVCEAATAGAACSMGVMMLPAGGPPPPPPPPPVAAATLGIKSEKSSDFKLTGESAMVSSERPERANPVTKVKNPVSKVKNPVSKIKNPVSKAKNPVSKANNLVSKAKNPVSKANHPVTKVKNPVSKVNNPVSKVNNPVSKIKNPVSKANNPVSKVWFKNRRAKWRKRERHLEALKGTFTGQFGSFMQPFEDSFYSSYGAAAAAGYGATGWATAKSFPWTPAGHPAGPAAAAAAPACPYAGPSPYSPLYSQPPSAAAAAAGPSSAAGAAGDSSPLANSLRLRAAAKQHAAAAAFAYPAAAAAAGLRQPPPSSASALSQYTGAPPGAIGKAAFRDGTEWRVLIEERPFQEIKKPLFNQADMLQATGGISERQLGSGRQRQQREARPAAVGQPVGQLVGVAPQASFSVAADLGSKRVRRRGDQTGHRLGGSDHGQLVVFATLHRGRLGGRQEGPVRVSRRKRTPSAAGRNWRRLTRRSADALAGRIRLGGRCRLRPRLPEMRLDVLLAWRPTLGLRLGDPSAPVTAANEHTAEHY
uniref:AP2/ERF domain-containing protein n=1 Tax=Macrostomum lignano TaxID=282301 RepID=A0A1I8JKH4_9PLAT